MSSIAADQQTLERNSGPESPIVHSIRSSSLKNSPSPRSKSLSPRKRNANQPLHIRMNLTETQMDKITDAFTQKLNATRPSSTKTNKMIGDATSESSPQHQNNHGSVSNSPSSQRKAHETISVVSPTFSELMPRAKDDSIAERRQKVPPQIDISQHRDTKPQRRQMEQVDDVVSPLSVNRSSKTATSGRPASSSYSTERGELQPPRPLNVPSNRRSHQKQASQDAVVDIYNDWTNIYSSGVSPLSPEPAHVRESESQYPRRSKSLAEGMRRQKSPTKSTHAESTRLAQYPAEVVSESPLFSPLPLYFRGQDFPTVKRGGKTLIGNNGWLEKTGQETLGLDAENKTPQKRAGIFDSIKKIAKDMTELHHPHRRLPNTKTSAHLAISLDAREQSLLYCELEYHLTSALNSYISRELEKGRLAPVNFKKITDAWYQQGRPRVVGFRFDLETQIDLVALHVDDFTFCGRRQCSPVEIAGLLHAMKANARAMRVRTFCQPDSVIAKQLSDSQSLFGMVGAADEACRALGEIVHFFKVIVEREHRALQQRQREHRQTIKLPQNDQ